ncbi:MAG: hypothetical protein NT138_08485 [Planctomycetales bacterium]|nr:hypothetical protein [Planctomycetales bacterium]
MLEKNGRLFSVYWFLSEHRVTRFVYVFEVALRSLVASLFIASSFPHVANPLEFLNTVNSYQIVSVYSAVFVAAMVPILQLTSAIALLTDSFVEAAWFWSMCLFGLFVCAQAIVLWKGMDIECGCFGNTVHFDVSVVSMLALSALACCSALFWRVHALQRVLNVVTSSSSMV